MSKKFTFLLFSSLFALIAALTAIWFIYEEDIQVLNPKGWIAAQEHQLILISTYLMLIVVVPVFFLIVYFAWKYRETNKKSKYNPNWDNSYLLECIWWGLPCAIILVLGVITWKTCHELDPFRPIVRENKKPLTIQVIALQWKWLFLYPEQQIATLNYVRFPKETPIRFEITADAPMNSFWIPQLGGQIYAMPGMQTELHLIADEVGQFRGSSANLSGKGFAGMRFTAESSTEEDFTAWAQEVKSSTPPLSLDKYEALVKPSSNVAPAAYVLEAKDLYTQVVMKYME